MKWWTSCCGVADSHCRAAERRRHLFRTFSQFPIPSIHPPIPSIHPPNSDHSSTLSEHSSTHSEHSSTHSDHSSTHSDHSPIRSEHSSTHSDLTLCSVFCGVIWVYFDKFPSRRKLFKACWNYGGLPPPPRPEKVVVLGAGAWSIKQEGSNCWKRKVEWEVCIEVRGGRPVATEPVWGKIG